MIDLHRRKPTSRRQKRASRASQRRQRAAENGGTGAQTSQALSFEVFHKIITGEGSGWRKSVLCSALLMLCAQNLSRFGSARGQRRFLPTAAFLEFNGAFQLWRLKLPVQHCNVVYFGSTEFSDYISPWSTPLNIKPVRW